MRHEQVYMSMLEPAYAQGILKSIPLHQMRSVRLGVLEDDGNRWVGKMSWVLEDDGTLLLDI